MTELKFNGPATITGFPRDKAFSVDFDGEAFVLKAGKDVWLRVEREPAQQTISISPTQVPTDIEKMALAAVVAQTEDPQPEGLPKGAQTNAESAEKKERKPRGPNQKIDEAAIIQIDPNRENPYRGLRGKYYETLKTAQGRTVGWWAGTSMVKSLEGSPTTLLKFFISEGVVTLAFAEQQASPQQGLPAGLMGPGQVNPQRIPAEQQGLPAGFGQLNPAQQGFAAQQIAGPMWAPSGGSPVVPGGNNGGGATFMG